MYNIVIIEDEVPARKKLKRFIEQACGEYQILAELDTITAVASFFEKEQDIDVVFSDIELRDGNVFEIYTKLSLNCPIIFTTAYNAFFMDAFDANGIAYLLKPYSFDKFSSAWHKYLRLQETKSLDYNALLTKLGSLVNSEEKKQEIYKEQFVIRAQKAIYFLKTIDIVFFQADNGVVFAFDKENKKHMMSQVTLKEIEADLDPHFFFRINRSEVLHKNYIEKLERYSKNSIAIYINDNQRKLITSQSKTSDFNTWIGV